MSSALRTKEFLEFQQTLKDLESQVRKLIREAAESGPSERTRNLTGKVYDLAERANQIRPQEARNQSTTNQSILEKLPEQFNEDFGKFKGLVTFVERVRKRIPPVRKKRLPNSRSASRSGTMGSLYRSIRLRMPRLRGQRRSNRSQSVNRNNRERETAQAFRVALAYRSPYRLNSRLLARVPH